MDLNKTNYPEKTSVPSLLSGAQNSTEDDLEAPCHSPRSLGWHEPSQDAMESGEGVRGGIQGVAAVSCSTLWCQNR